jgi:hypothetical protein
VTSYNNGSMDVYQELKSRPFFDDGKPNVTVIRKDDSHSKSVRGTLFDKLA